LVALIFVLLPSSSEYFRRFFGRMNPILVIGVASVVGAIALWVLQTNYGYVILKGRMTLRGVVLSLALATALAVAIVITDFLTRYPEDINVPVPQALLFYPAVGFVAEVIFHILPLALMLLVLAPLAGGFGKERVVWLGTLIVAAIEPTIQVLFIETSLTT
jgi:hypothetical protein